MQTNQWRGTADAQPNPGPRFAPEIPKNIEIESIRPASTTCCDTCCGGNGHGCSLYNGIKSISIWFGIVALIMFIIFIILVSDAYLTSIAFWILIYSIIHALCSFEGIRLINFQNSQEYHVRGKRLYAIYIITTTINSCIVVSIIIISLQYLILGSFSGFFYGFIYGAPFITHLIICLLAIQLLKDFFKMQSFEAHLKLKEQRQNV